MATPVETMSTASTGPGGPMVWLESGRGPIARGAALLLTPQGARVRLMGDASVEPGDHVELRLGFEPGAPTLAATARVLLTREANDTIECELEWTHSGPEREQLEAAIAARS